MEQIRTFPSASLGGNSLAARADDIRDRLNSALRIVDQVSEVPVSRFSDQPVTVREIRAVLKYRRSRDAFFESDLFADPAWDILLELYLAKLGQQKMSVGSLCLGAAVPSTTALRWISQLEQKGLIERKADPMDGRRYHVSLSDAGAHAMASYFRTVPMGIPVL